MLGPRRTVDQNIIEKDKDEPGGGRTEGHDEELEVPVVGMERCLLDVLWVHLHLVIAGLQVHLGEVPSVV